MLGKGVVDGKLNVSWQPGGPAVSWGSSDTALLDRQGRGLSLSALNWDDLTSTAGGSFGCLNIRRI